MRARSFRQPQTPSSSSFNLHPSFPHEPGEVTAAQLAAATATTATNTNAVATLDTPFADPDQEAMRQKANELILAARR